MRRMGRIIRLRPEYLDEYRRMHADVWPEVLAVISSANITNYTIFLKEAENLLFAYWEYVGTDYEADMARMGEAPAMQRWWTFTAKMQEPLDTRAEGEWWADMEDVFHLA